MVRQGINSRLRMPRCLLRRSIATIVFTGSPSPVWSSRTPVQRLRPWSSMEFGVQWRGRQRFRVRLAGALAVQALIGKIGKDPGPADHQPRTAAVFMRAGTDIEAGRRDVHGVAVRAGADDHIAALPGAAVLNCWAGKAMPSISDGHNPRRRHSDCPCFVVERSGLTNALRSAFRRAFDPERMPHVPRAQRREASPCRAIACEAQPVQEAFVGKSTATNFK
jgi:hypothetical protein